MKKALLLIFILAIAQLFAACSSSPQTATTTASPTPAATLVPATPTPEPTIEVVKTETKTLKDGSEVVTEHLANGEKREVRTFKKGPVAKVERVTKADGSQTAYITRSGDQAKVEVKEKSWIGKTMDATGDALSTAVGKTKDVGENVGDKTKEGVETAGEKTKEGAKTVGKKTKEGAETVGEKTKEGAKAVGKGVKSVGEKIKKAVQ